MYTGAEEMVTIYYDYVPDYGVNAFVGNEWDFYRSMSELLETVAEIYGAEPVVFIPHSLAIGTVITVESLVQ